MAQNKKKGKKQNGFKPNQKLESKIRFKTKPSSKNRAKIVKQYLKGERSTETFPPTQRCLEFSRFMLVPSLLHLSECIFVLSRVGTSSRDVFGVDSWFVI